MEQEDSWLENTNSLRQSANCGSTDRQISRSDNFAGFQYICPRLSFRLKFKCIQYGTIIKLETFEVNAVTYNDDQWLISPKFHEYHFLIMESISSRFNPLVH